MRLDRRAPPGCQPDPKSWAYADAWIRQGDPSLSLPGMSFWHREISPRGYSRISEPGLWLPLSCAIASDGGSGGAGTNSASSISWSHTPSGSNVIVWVAVNRQQVAITSVTYDGNNMTWAVDNGGNSGSSLWYYLNPPSGTKTIQVTLGGVAGIVGASASFNGVQQSGVPDATGNANGVVLSSKTVQVTPNATGCWVVVGGQVTHNANEQAGTGLTQRGSTQQAGTNDDYIGIFDSNGTVTAGSADSFTVSLSSGTGDFSVVACSFAPAAGGGATSPFPPWPMLQQTVWRM